MAFLSELLGQDYQQSFLKREMLHLGRITVLVIC